MAKSVARVNGRNGESMWIDGDQVHFKSVNVTHMEKKEDFESFRICNVEEARRVIDESRERVGVWTMDQKGSSGKTSLLVGSGRGFCWVMEVNRSQNPNAYSFSQGICPTNNEPEEEYKLYAAIQTPKGALFTVGSIVCTFGAFFCISNVQQPIIALVLAGLAIYMFVHVK